MPNDIEAMKARLRERSPNIYRTNARHHRRTDNEAATALDQQSARIQELKEVLRTAENRIVAFYDGIAPQAHYEDLGIEGNRSGNRHADNDEVVLRIRSALGRNADG